MLIKERRKVCTFLRTKFIDHHQKYKLKKTRDIIEHYNKINKNTPLVQSVPYI